MTSVRRTIYELVKPIREHLGYDLINRNKFGYDPFLDIRRLSKAWGFPIESFFDVGANDGGTVRLACSYFPQARIYAFEPHPKTFARLVERMAGHRRFQAYNVAVSSEIGEADLFEYGSPRINSLVPNAPYAVRFEASANKIPVRCITIDSFCSVRSIDDIDVLKIDVEGFDLEVLKGADNLISAGAVRFIYFEFNEILNQEGAFGGALAPIAELITPHGYRFVATYTDYVVSEGNMFGVSNALFALPPGSAALR